MSGVAVEAHALDPVNFRTASEGVTEAPCGKGRYNFTRRWTKPEILNWVAVYLQSDGCHGTYADYDRWARTTPDAPSSGTMRNALGKWSDVKAAALLLLDDENGRAARCLPRPPPGRRHM